jgi:hypothetical protein
VRWDQAVGVAGGFAAVRQLEGEGGEVGGDQGDGDEGLHGVWIDGAESGLFNRPKECLDGLPVQFEDLFDGFVHRSTSVSLFDERHIFLIEELLGLLDGLGGVAE